MAISKTIASDIVFGGKSERPWMRLLSFKPYRKNTLRGYVDVELGIGLQITGLTLHGDSGERWIGMPSKPVLDTDGRHVAGPDGKKPWAKILSWRDRRLGDAFGKAVVALALPLTRRKRRFA